MPSADKRERQRQNRDARRVAAMEADKRRKRNRAIRNISIALGLVVIVFVIVSITNSGDSSDSSDKRSASAYTATIDTSEGTITVDLDAARYPTSVQQFVKLSEDGFYDGLPFDRIAKDFVIQTGSPDNATSGGSGSSVVGEVPTTTPAYPVGSVAFAKAGTDPAGTADSVFFIVTGSSNLDLPAEYAGIGQVSQGLDVAKKIGKLYPASGDGAPTKDVTINKITVSGKPKAAATTTTAAP